MNARIAEIATVFLLALAGAASAASVSLLRAPDGGIQPQAVVDGSGKAHLIYFKGDPKAGELFYTHVEGDSFAPSIRVTAPSQGPMAIGNIRGAQLAVGKAGRPHVAWMGGGKIMYYARLNDAGTAFEAPRNLVTWAGGLDGGGTVAADQKGNVYVAWHGSPPENKAGEVGRAVFVARSSDEGKTFSKEERVTTTEKGVCGCCGMRGYTDSRGDVFFLYRAADGTSRDMMLLESVDAGKTFKSALVSRWAINQCPMSSSTMAPAGQGILAATEQKGQVSFARISADNLAVSETIQAPGLGKRKHPVVLTNSKAETLLAWTENMGWAKGGSLSWQLYDADQKSIAEKKSAPGVPVWSLITGFTKPNGDFVIIY